MVRSQSIGHSQFDDVSTTVSFLSSTNKLAKLKGALNESSKLETAVRPLEFFAFTVYMAYLKYWYPSRVYDIVNMIYQAQNILLPMAVAKLTHNLAGSLSAHCVRIPALVQTTSFPWETITIHLNIVLLRTILLYILAFYILQHLPNMISDSCFRIYSL